MAKFKLTCTSSARSARELATMACPACAASSTPGCSLTGSRSVCARPRPSRNQGPGCEVDVRYFDFLPTARCIARRVASARGARPCWRASTSGCPSAGERVVQGRDGEPDRLLQGPAGLHGHLRAAEMAPGVVTSRRERRRAACCIQCAAGLPALVFVPEMSPPTVAQVQATGLACSRSRRTHVGHP